MSTPENTEKKEKRFGFRFYLMLKITVNLVLIILGAIAIVIFLSSMQTRTSLAKQQENNELALKEVVSILNKNSENTEVMTEIYHDGNWKTLEDIKLLFDNGLFEKAMANDDTIRAEIFDDISRKAGIPYLFLVTLDGKIELCPDTSLFGRNPASTPHMTQENLNSLLTWDQNENRSSPVSVKNQFGTYYFYSIPYEYRGTRYALVEGVSSWTLDERISSLNDVSAVLSRMGVINDGFMFAVSRKDKMFLYYNDGTNLLTGQSAYDSGLNKYMMADGYKGIQTILGEEYYCTSKALGLDTVIVAAAKEESVISHDKYVLLWSVLGFSLVMILCLVYAIIVHNDYIRKGTSTKRITLFRNHSNPIYFNRSVFIKVLPLMFIGLIAVYAITFYTQTLLEISEGIDKSNVILQEVTGRYLESLDSLEVVEDYYNSRFLATARIMTFIVEESPEVLNENSDHYFSTYDEDGNRHYILDDEGNPLKSIAYSQRLQELCNENSINAIYIFDEDGRTIATSTGNWFFELSTNEEDQSWPFREVLSGKADSLLQTVMVNDLGEETQYFGVTMNYYTTKDSAGNTVYVSRYDFELACAEENVSGVRTAGGITKHSSLLPVEIDRDLIGSITATANSEYALSTEMLTGGAIMTFDTSKDHVCTYSPVKLSIGQTADELGVSPNAFSGTPYYGFNSINGVTYFQYYRYLDDIFLATSIPKSGMFTSRANISLVTALVCMFLIMVLVLTVTVTSKKEEEVYESISLEQVSSSDLNSAIFNTILPSGRAASTIQAQLRWNNQPIPWFELSPEMKLGLIMRWIIAVPIIYFVLSALGLGNNAEEDSVIRYILVGNWDHSLNVFALSASILVLAVTIIVLQIARIPVRLFTALLGTRGETIGHLLLSIIEYGGTLGSVFYCLYLFGIDSASLIASAGILSLVLGLGAQSLIKDILAGIFMVFEGEFRVGDIVTINGFRGTVTDIGLRTTKISGDGNVKIFNNSEISGVLNMTKETSVASVSVSMDYTKSIDYVDEVLERELPKLREENSLILDGPTNIGIEKFGRNSYTITVEARCNERDVDDVSRYMNKAILRILHSNGIIALSEDHPVQGGDGMPKRGGDEWPF